MGRGTVVLCALLLGGCDTVFDIKAVPGGAACASPAGHDEDGDGIDDACDFCPGDPGSNAADADGDGIGDACDPTPGNPGDTLIQFFAFAKPGDGDHFDLKTGVTVADDALVFATRDVSSTFVDVVTPQPTLPFAVQLGGTIDDEDLAMYDQIAIDGNSVSPSRGDLEYCAMFHTASASSNADGLSASASNGSQAESTALLPNTYVAGTTLVARMTFQPDGTACDLSTVRADGGRMHVSAMQTRTGAAASGNLAVNIQRTSLHLRWLALYQLP